MTTVLEQAQSSDKAQRDRAITRIIENAVKLARDSEWSTERAYKIAAELIADFALPGEECKQAIEKLRKELNYGKPD